MSTFHKFHCRNFDLPPRRCNHISITLTNWKYDSIASSGKHISITQIFQDKIHQVSWFLRLDFTCNRWNIQSVLPHLSAIKKNSAPLHQELQRRSQTWARLIHSSWSFWGFLLMIQFTNHSIIWRIQITDSSYTVGIIPINE